MDRDAAESLIHEIYAVALSRVPGTKELDYWCGRAQSGESASNILAAFRNSQEFKKQRAVRLKVYIVRIAFARLMLRVRDDIVVLLLLRVCRRSDRSICHYRGARKSNCA